jgi:hypothetical protein
VEIVSAQNREIEALKQRCAHLEGNDQAVMVAFTTFFHILSAGGVSDLDSMANVFGSIIDQAQRLDLPGDSVSFLRSVETMLRAQHGSEATSPKKGTCQPRRVSDAASDGSS